MEGCWVHSWLRRFKFLIPEGSPNSVFSPIVDSWRASAPCRMPTRSTYCQCGGEHRLNPSLRVEPRPRQACGALPRRRKGGHTYTQADCVEQRPRSKDSNGRRRAGSRKRVSEWNLESTGSAGNHIYLKPPELKIPRALKSSPEP